MLSRGLSASALALLVSLAAIPVSAQVHTSCNPLNQTCPSDPALGTEYIQYFNATPSVWNVTNGDITYDPQTGAAFTVSKKGDSPTMQTNFYFFWGRTEVWLKVAPGAGIISSIVWLSDILDEVDWEFFGSNDTHAETNWFGRGEPVYTNALYHPMSSSPQSDYHNYTTTWTNTSMDFYIDGAKVRTLLPADANNGKNYPQTPMRLSLGIWAAGDPSEPEGTREWAQGTTDYKNGPFTMYVKSAAVQDYSTGKEYVYSDHSGTWESIQVVAGNSTAKEEIEKQPDPTLAQKWAALPSGTRTGIFAAGAGAALVGLAGGIFYCFRQRRRGAQEAALAAKRAENDRMEMDRFHEGDINASALPRSHSPDSSLHDITPMQEKAWDPTTNYVSPVPLLRDDPLNSSAHTEDITPYTDTPTPLPPTQAAGAGTSGRLP